MHSNDVRKRLISVLTHLLVIKRELIWLMRGAELAPTRMYAASLFIFVEETCERIKCLIGDDTVSTLLVGDEDDKHRGAKSH